MEYYLTMKRMKSYGKLILVPGIVKPNMGTLLEKGYNTLTLHPSAHAVRRINVINIYLMFVIC